MIPEREEYPEQPEKQDDQDIMEVDPSEGDSAGRVHRRRRSASCSVLQSTASRLAPGSCDTILEEPLGEEIHQMLDNES